MENIFRGVKEDYVVTRLQELDNKVWLHRLLIKGLKTGHEYVLSQQKNSLEWQCSCKGWIFSLKRCGHRECDHVSATGLMDLQPGANPPAAIIEVIGEMRWYASQAKRFGKVEVAE